MLKFWKYFCQKRRKIAIFKLENSQLDRKVIVIMGFKEIAIFQNVGENRQK
jgi:hypothetical protein